MQAKKFCFAHGMSYLCVMKRLASIILAAALAAGCAADRSADTDGTIYVTIAPLAEIVHAITGDDFPVEVLVPAGASPETFEPTPRQFIALNRAQFILSTGLIDFENSLVSRVDNPEKVVDLSCGIELIEGTCSHVHEGHHHAHAHGADPHVWTAPRELATMARNAFEAIMARYPDSVKYEIRYDAYADKLRQLDEECAAACAASARKCFVVFHPALTYFARDYGMEQIAVEHDGKEPAAKHLGEVIERARENGVCRVFYQSQFPKSSVEIIADDIGAECVEFDPLAPALSDNIREITRLITE